MRTIMNTLNSYLNTIREADFSYLSQDGFLLLGAIVLGLLLILLLLRLRPPSRIRAFQGETGYVEISRHALLGLVHSACEQLPEVRKPSVKVRGRRRVNLSVRIRVDGSAHLRDTASYLQTHLKDALENNLGVEKLGKIEILVTGIRAASTPRKIDLNQSPPESRTPAPAPAPEPAAKNEPAEKPAPLAPAPATPKPDLSPDPKAPAGSAAPKPDPTAPSGPTPPKPGSTASKPSTPFPAKPGNAKSEPGGGSDKKTNQRGER